MAGRAAALTIEQDPAPFGRIADRLFVAPHEAVEGRVTRVLRAFACRHGSSDLNVSAYSGILASLATTSSGDFCAISTGFKTGSLACSSKLGARPSQNCEAWNIALRMVGALRCPNCPCTPADVGLFSR